MSAKRRPSESVLDEFNLMDGEFGSQGRAHSNVQDAPRLERTHTPIKLAQIIEETPHQNRITTFDPEIHPEDAELLESVQRHGVLEPVYLQRLSFEPGEKTQYAPIAGHRRITAARMVGQDVIAAIIAKADDDPQDIALAENLGHRQLTAYEKALSLSAMKSREPEISLRALAKKSGVPFGTVSSLISAYEKSTPTLRGLFAEGVAPRAIQELQPVLSDLSEEEQVELVPNLSGITQSQARSFRGLIEKGIEPAVAANSAMGFSDEATNAPSEEHIDLENPGTQTESPKGQRTTSKRVRSASDTPLPKSTDHAGIEVLRLRTGAARDKIEVLINDARSENCEYSTLLIACAYAAAGGDMERAIALSRQATGQRGTKSNILRHLRTLERARRLISSCKEAPLREFLERIFFGAPLNVDRVPEAQREDRRE